MFRHKMMVTFRYIIIILLLNCFTGLLSVEAAVVLSPLPLPSPYYFAYLLNTVTTLLSQIASF